MSNWLHKITNDFVQYNKNMCKNKLEYYSIYLLDTNVLELVLAVHIHPVNENFKEHFWIFTTEFRSLQIYKKLQKNVYVKNCRRISM